MQLKIFWAKILFLSFSVAIWAKNDPQCDQAFGNCIPDTNCKNQSSLRSGLCPTQAGNIKCCIPYQEEACASLGGICQRGDKNCDGDWQSGKCPTQPDNVKCCVKKTAPPPPPPPPPPPAPPAPAENNCAGNKNEEALDMIFEHEGGCQNSPKDSGNIYKGKIGYSCMGITPQVADENRDKFKQCGGFSGDPADFCKWCYDKSQSGFKQGSAEIYGKKYFYPCAEVPQPVFSVCADISVNSGPGRSKKFLSQLGPVGSDAKEYARKLNDLHRNFYKDLAASKPQTYGAFLNGWLKRADKRDEFINNYKCGGSSGSASGSGSGQSGNVQKPEPLPTKDEEPFAEEFCTSIGGKCQLTTKTCDGDLVSGKCKTQPANVKCCVPSKSATGSQAQAPDSSSACGGDKSEEALEMIFEHEGLCQNSPKDSGNLLNGKIGYSCMGITPQVAFDNQAKFKDCGGFTGHPADFCKWCFDKSPAGFKSGSAQIYAQKYFYVCKNLPQPAFSVCSDISVNSGPGKAESLVKDLGAPGADVKDFARRLNEKHRQFYKNIAAKNANYANFLKGWLIRAQKRDEYIENYHCTPTGGSGQKYAGGPDEDEAPSVEPYQEEPCETIGGQCKRTDWECNDEWISGKCPTQASNVKCCVHKIIPVPELKLAPRPKVMVNEKIFCKDMKSSGWCIHNRGYMIENCEGTCPDW